MQLKQFRTCGLLLAAPVVALLSGAGCESPSGLTTAEIFALAQGQIVGDIATSPDGSLLAYSDGVNVYVIDVAEALNNPSAQFVPVQVTNTTSAFAPTFLNQDELVFGSIDATVPDEVQLFSTSPTAMLGEPTPNPFATISAVDLGLATGTPLTPPEFMQITSNGAFGTATFGGEPFLLNFVSQPVGVTALNSVFPMNIQNPVISPGMDQFVFADAAGQIGLTSFSDGFVNPNQITPVGFGTFPTFTPSNNVAFFSDNGINIGTPAAGFNTFGFNQPFVPRRPAFLPDGNSFFTTNAVGNSLVLNTLPPPTTIGGVDF